LPQPKRRRGAKAKGIRYEKAVRSWLTALFPDAIHEQWFEFTDSSGYGICQTDHLVVFDHLVVVFESKLTQTHQAIAQVNLLYRPVVEKVWGRPSLGVQICKNLVVDPGPGLIRNPRSIPTFKPSDRVWTLHYIGEQA
jgi:hypothetical protein